MKSIYLKTILIFVTACSLTACQTASVDPSVVKPVTKNNGPITIKGHCVQRETDGHRDKITVEMEGNKVKSFDWTAQPRAGSCRFQLKDFTQISTLPNADLQSKKDKKCHIYAWQDDDHITLAIYGCKKICKQNDRILPILLDIKSGACKARPADK